VAGPQEGAEVSFEKMSKSKGNGVSPEEAASKFGVDTLRVWLMFSGPPESDISYEEKALGAVS